MFSGLRFAEASSFQVLDVDPRDPKPNALETTTLHLSHPYVDASSQPETFAWTLVLQDVHVSSLWMVVWVRGFGVWNAQCLSILIPEANSYAGLSAARC